MVTTIKTAIRHPSTDFSFTLECLFTFMRKSKFKIITTHSFDEYFRRFSQYILIFYTQPRLAYVCGIVSTPDFDHGVSITIKPEYLNWRFFLNRVINEDLFHLGNLLSLGNRCRIIVHDEVCSGENLLKFESSRNLNVRILRTTSLFVHVPSRSLLFRLSVPCLCPIRSASAVTTCIHKITLDKGIWTLS